MCVWRSASRYSSGWVVARGAANGSVAARSAGRQGSRTGRSRSRSRATCAHPWRSVSVGPTPVSVQEIFTSRGWLRDPATIAHPRQRRPVRPVPVRDGRAAARQPRPVAGRAGTIRPGPARRSRRCSGRAHRTGCGAGAARGPSTRRGRGGEADCAAARHGGRTVRGTGRKLTSIRGRCGRKHRRRGSVRSYVQNPAGLSGGGWSWQEVGCRDQPTPEGAAP